MAQLSLDEDFFKKDKLSRVNVFYCTRLISDIITSSNRNYENEKKIIIN